jgi:glycosyltransferase involved in cell wall biosynthesis
MLVVFSHLRWHLVWQRPQHLMSRLAREMPVLYVEEARGGSTTSEAQVRQCDGVTIVTPCVSLEYGGFTRKVNAQISGLLDRIVPSDSDPVYWYYTPMALGAEPTVCRPGLRVYDAMDDLASFNGAPAALRAQESQLIAQVDLVFAGGPSLFRQRQDLHPAVYCFPSGVEPEHFRRFTPRPDLTSPLAGRPRPILGYYGVIDERIDRDLLARIADARPEWTIVLVGPLAKIERSDLPFRPNIVRFGKQAYSDLPAFLAGFDVAMMPFAQNAATRAISPTKTLEYLAGGKPVVSTPIADVIELYGDVVGVDPDAEAFVAACESVLMRTAAEQQQWQARVAHIVAANDWDVIAAKMADLIQQARLDVLRPPTPSAAVALSA